MYRCVLLFAETHVKGRFFQAILLKDGNLMFINTFQFQSSKDFIYYVLLLFDQFDLKQEEVNLMLSGQLIKDSEIYRLLFRYIKKVNFIQHPSFISFGPKMKTKPSYYYFDIFSLFRKEG